jgi:hypothetical protein
MCFKKFKEDSIQIPSQRSQIPSFHSNGPVMRPDAHQCPKVSNYSRFHPSRRLSNTSECSLVFDNKLDFLLRHRYGKTAASVRTLGLHRSDAILDRAKLGEELQPSGCRGNTVRTPIILMKITCSRSATIRTLGQHRPDVALIWYCVKRVMKSRFHSCPSRHSQLPFRCRLEKSVPDSI